MSYREAVVTFYTGTGNSRRVALWLADAVADTGARVTADPMTSAQPTGEVGRGAHTLLGLVFPTHGFTAPWPVLRFALGLPRRRDTHAVVIATRGALRIGPLHVPGFEGTAALLVAVILAAKGYDIRMAVGMDMPSNWTALHPGLPPAAVDSIIHRARGRMTRLSDALLSGQRRHPSWFVPVVGLLLAPVSLAYLVAGRFFLSRLFFASDRCTGCGLCAEHCPHNAIEMPPHAEGMRPFWTSRCHSCMRCMAYCPTRAVEASHLIAVGAYLLARVTPVMATFGWISTGVRGLAFLTRVPRWIVAGVETTAIPILIYPLVHRLCQIKPLDWLLSRGTLTRAYRRYHEPGATLDGLDRSKRWS